ncbi:MAG: 50S ribosomal protein L6 [Bacilli bacterium]
MSRIGNRIIEIPSGVTISINNVSVKVNGPKGSLETPITREIKVEQKENTLVVTRINETLKAKAMHGTVNANITNMIKGVVEGYEKGIEILGVGYRFNVKPTSLVINAGYSHPVELAIPSGIKIEQISNTEIKVLGIDKILVGEYSANIRKVRQPEPYKGKGIRYKGEVVRRKEGKKAA